MDNDGAVTNLRNLAQTGSPFESNGQSFALVDPIGSVETVSGRVSVTRTDGTKVDLEVGDRLYQGDMLSTGEDGAIGIVFADQSMLAMDENSEMVLDEMIYDPDAESGSAVFSLFSGAATVVSGRIAKLDQDAMSIETPTATIGIRGTKIYLEQWGSRLELVNLPEQTLQGQTVGEIVIYDPSGKVMGSVNTLGSGFQWDPTTQAAPVSVQMSETQVNDLLAISGKLLPKTMDEKALDALEESEAAAEEAEAMAEEAEAIEEVAEALVRQGADAETVEAAQATAAAAALQARQAAEKAAQAAAQADAAVDAAKTEVGFEVNVVVQLSSFAVGGVASEGLYPSQTPLSIETFQRAESIAGIRDLVSEVIEPVSEIGNPGRSDPPVQPKPENPTEGSTETVDEVIEREIAQETETTHNQNEGAGKNSNDEPSESTGNVNVIVGNDGKRTLVGSEGDDDLVWYSGIDVIKGMGGADTIKGGAGDDIIYSGEGMDDILQGFDQKTDSSSTLDGGKGNDRLIGAAGVDYMTGGEGSDTFVLSLNDPSNPDVLTDFESSIDKIEIYSKNTHNIGEVQLTNKNFLDTHEHFGITHMKENHELTGFDGNGDNKIDKDLFIFESEPLYDDHGYGEEYGDGEGTFATYLYFIKAGSDMTLKSSYSIVARFIDNEDLVASDIYLTS